MILAEPTGGHPRLHPETDWTSQEELRQHALYLFINFPSIESSLHVTAPSADRSETIETPICIL